jgi:hypothetical protein
MSGTDRQIEDEPSRDNHGKENASRALADDAAAWVPSRSSNESALSQSARTAAVNESTSKAQVDSQLWQSGSGADYSKSKDSSAKQGITDAIKAGYYESESKAVAKKLDDTTSKVLPAVKLEGDYQDNYKTFKAEDASLTKQQIKDAAGSSYGSSERLTFDKKFNEPLYQQESNVNRALPAEAFEKMHSQSYAVADSAAGKSLKEIGSSVASGAEQAAVNVYKDAAGAALAGNENGKYSYLRKDGEVATHADYAYLNREARAINDYGVPEKSKGGIADYGSLNKETFKTLEYRNSGAEAMKAIDYGTQFKSDYSKTLEYRSQEISDLSGKWGSAEKYGSVEKFDKQNFGSYGESSSLANKIPSGLREMVDRSGSDSLSGKIIEGISADSSAKKYPYGTEVASSAGVGLAGGQLANILANNPKETLGQANNADGRSTEGRVQNLPYAGERNTIDGAGKLTDNATQSRAAESHEGSHVQDARPAQSGSAVPEQGAGRMPVSQATRPEINDYQTGNASRTNNPVENHREAPAAGTAANPTARPEANSASPAHSENARTEIARNESQASQQTRSENLARALSANESQPGLSTQSKLEQLAAAAAIAAHEAARAAVSSRVEAPQQPANATANQGLARDSQQSGRGAESPMSLKVAGESASGKAAGAEVATSTRAAGSELAAVARVISQTAAELTASTKATATNASELSAAAKVTSQAVGEHAGAIKATALNGAELSASNRLSGMIVAEAALSTRNAGQHSINAEINAANIKAQALDSRNGSTNNAAGQRGDAASIMSGSGRAPLPGSQIAGNRGDIGVAGKPGPTAAGTSGAFNGAIGMRGSDAVLGGRTIGNVRTAASDLSGGKRYFTGAEIGLLIAAVGIAKARMDSRTNKIDGKGEAEGDAAIKASRQFSIADGARRFPGRELTLSALLAITGATKFRDIDHTLGMRSHECTVRIERTVGSFKKKDQIEISLPQLAAPEPNGDEKSSSEDGFLNFLPAAPALLKALRKKDNDDEARVEKGKDSDNTPSTPKIPVLRYRRIHQIAAGESLVSIAESQLKDANLAWLIADINAAKLTERRVDGKRVVEVLEGQKLELPLAHEIAAFYRRHDSEADPDNLVTIVVEPEFDQDRIEQHLNEVLGLARGAF